MKVDGLAEPRSSEPWPLRMYTFVRQSGMPDGTMIGLPPSFGPVDWLAYALTHQSANYGVPRGRDDRGPVRERRRR